MSRSRVLDWYQYAAPAILTPLSFYLWFDGRWTSVAVPWLVPILWAYIVPGIGTNALKMWEFDTRLRLGRFRPHHGFVFGSATSMLGWCVHLLPHYVILMPILLGIINVAYDIKALQAGVLRVYNQPAAEGKSATFIALDYAPWFFGGFGAVYGWGLHKDFWLVLGLSLIVPTTLYIFWSFIAHGHTGLEPRPRPVEGQAPRLSTEPPGEATANPPETLNWLLLAIAAITTSALLWLACHAPWPIALAACAAFTFVNNLPFVLMHEAVHGVAAKGTRNTLFGFLAACMFPTSFSLQRVAHLGHHARNRTDTDLYDYYLPHESRFVRNLWLYGGNLLGLYWFCIPLSNLFYLIATPLYRSQRFIERIAPRMGFGPHVREIAQINPWRVWFEIACAFGFQLALWLALDLHWKGWLLAHWLFAMHWSALQYVDHAWSERDVTRGAWNLRVPAVVRWLTLNYQLHLAHHAHPAAPWTQLPRLVEATAPQPSFWQIYKSLWRHGVQPAPPMGAGAGAGLFS